MFAQLFYIHLSLWAYLVAAQGAFDPLQYVNQLIGSGNDGSQRFSSES
jgi:hypothetical protein